MKAKTSRIEESRVVWVAWSNTDLTEGRGTEYPLCVCLCESTAHRLGKGRYVQGTDCEVRVDTLFRVGTRWYGPVSVVYPSPEDTAADEQAQAESKKKLARLAALEKAKAAGLSPEDIEALR